MGVKNTVKRHVKEGFNVRQWLGLDNLKKDAKKLKNMMADVLIPPKSDSIRVETFEESLERLNLTEADVQKRIRTCVWTIAFLVTIIFVLMCYAFYLWHQHLHRGVFLCAILMLLLGSFTFREHFYYFQMKKRRLGCSVLEWVKFVFWGK